jgi:murein DD-endopeptidase MepM/ murein hydrolase activator NlpD
MDTTIPKRPTVDVLSYTVQAGDNLFLIADKYGLKPETILWGNYETLHDNPQFLAIGQVLNILPTNGVYYEWKNGDTVESIANFFKVGSEAILDYPGNRLLPDLTNPTAPEIAPGTWLIIPGGKRVLKDWGPPAISRANPAAAAYYGEGYCGQIYEGAIGIGTFIWPTVAKYLSGYDYTPPIHNGIDIAGAEGNAIFAVDSGVVVFAGWSQYGFGNLVVLDHGNGWQSAYAHLSGINVTCGQSVAQGTVIGALGTTGNSTGPHLHFELRSEVYGKVNPWDFLIK